MAHYAKVEDGVVTQVIVADSKEWCQANLGGEWIQTSYNTHGGVNYPSRWRSTTQELRRYWIHLGWIRLCRSTTISHLGQRTQILICGKHQLLCQLKKESVIPGMKQQPLGLKYKI
jgi:hypothetical protein